MLKEFKEFISRGNVLELAVGLILATYFGAIIKSLVNDVIMPPIGQIIGGINFDSIKYVIQEAEMNGQEIITPEVAIYYGRFINTIIVFILVALTVFLVVKAYNNMLRKKKKEEPNAAPPAPTKQELLLEDIRDLLKKNNR